MGTDAEKLGDAKGRGIVPRAVEQIIREVGVG